MQELGLSLREREDDKGGGAVMKEGGLSSLQWVQMLAGSSNKGDWSRDVELSSHCCWGIRVWGS